MTSPMIVNDVTNNRYDEQGRFNATWWAVSSRRLAAATADQMALLLGQSLGLGLYTKNTTIPAGVRGTNPKLILGAIRTWAKGQIGILFSRIGINGSNYQGVNLVRGCAEVPGSSWQIVGRFCLSPAGTYLEYYHQRQTVVADQLRSPVLIHQRLGA